MKKFITVAGVFLLVLPAWGQGNLNNFYRGPAHSFPPLGATVFGPTQGRAELGFGPLDEPNEIWVKQAPIPTWYNVEGIAPISDSEAWIASGPLLGDVGQLAHTADGGRTWRVIDTPRQVNAVFFKDSLHGWAAGNAFMHTTDGGENWIIDNYWGSIYDLFFLDTQTGWACGNGSVNYYTTDGGLHWTAVSAPGGYTMTSIWFLDAQNGWSVNYGGQIFRSTNGGQSWTLLATVDANNLQMIQFFDPLEGWTIGGDKFYHTTDGGQTWNPSSVPFNTWVYSARFYDRVNGVAVGERGNVLHTSDSGQSWQTIQENGSGQRLWDVEFATADTVFLAGDNGVISRSTNGGLAWNSIQSGGAAITHGFDAIDSLRAWAGQDSGEIVYTTNGGRQWVRANVQGFDEFGHVLAVAFADSSSGWAGGWNDVFPFGSRGPICHTNDGGRTWQQQFEIADFFVEGLEAIDAQTAFAVGQYEFGSGGLVLRTTNGGITWQDVTPDDKGFRDVFFINASTGWVAGSGIYKTTNGGTTWTRQYSNGELDAISFCDSQNGWAVGYSNVVLHTTDGGANWLGQDANGPPLAAYTGITAISPTNAWIAGWAGFVARTTDGGLTWQQVIVPDATAVDFEDLLFTDFQHGWVGGNIGIWHRTVLQSPDQLTVFRGIQIGGTLEDVFESDDLRMRFNPGFTLNSSEAPVWLIFDATLSSNKPASLEIVMESQAGTPGLTSTLEAWNWTSVAYDVVDVSETSFNNDTIVTVDLSSGISDYAEAETGAVRTRVGWRKTGFAINFPWEVRLDQLVWIVE